LKRNNPWIKPFLETRGTHREGDKEAEKMAKECEKRKARAIKLLENAQASYEK
jgi:hypothetical protein